MVFLLFFLWLPSAFLTSLFTQSSQLSCGRFSFLQSSCFFVSDIFGNLSSFIMTMCPAHFIRLFTILPTIQALVPTYYLRSFILLLYTLFTSAILIVQLFSHTCSLCCCSSNRAIIATGIQDLPFSLLETFLSIITPSTFLHAFAPACILRRTSTSTRPFSDIYPYHIHKILYLLNVFPFQPGI